MLQTGIRNEINIEVTMKDAASSWKSGNLDVFATPAMIAYMEQTCANCVESEIENGFSTVGTLVNVKHLRATPVGGHVRIECELLTIDRKRLIFSVAAFDEKGVIGEGTHERFIIDINKFMEKLK